MTRRYYIVPDPPSQQGGPMPPQHAYRVQVAGGFKPSQLAGTGVLSFAAAKLLGASLPGALVMGFGNMLWEAGSGNIAPGWKRYVLGLFRKPEQAAASPPPQLPHQPNHDT
jgi:hypothetical protein